jgi:3-hydroxybutyryl-CoA dehydratase
MAKTTYFEELELGQTAMMVKAVREADVIAFADISGDHNPLHLDEVYAKGTIFKGRIAHGMLTAGYISAVFAMELPGPGAVYVSQTLNFRGPVRLGDEVKALVRVIDLYPAKKRAKFDCVCTVGDRVVLEGEAIMMVPAKA